MKCLRESVPAVNTDDEHFATIDHAATLSGPQ